MHSKPLRVLTLAAASLVGSMGLVLAQTGTGSSPGSAPGMSGPAPSVDTGASAPSKMPLVESNDPAGPHTTGSVGATANPPGNPPGTIDSGPGAAVSSGASGRNPCYPGQSGQQVGSTNPSGMESQCK